MLLLVILIAGLALFVVTLGVPAMLGSDSAAPDGIGFVILAVMVAGIVWLMGAWWVLAPIALLVAWVHWLDRDVREAPVDPAGLDEDGRSARTRTRGRRLSLAIIAAAALFAAIFVLTAIGYGLEIEDLIVPGFVVSLVAVGLFRFSYYRSVRRDDVG